MQCRSLFALSLLCAATSVMAQDYPNKVIKLQVPFAPGGTTDITAQIKAEYEVYQKVVDSAKLD